MGVIKIKQNQQHGIYKHLLILGNRGLQITSGECEDDAGAGTRPSASVFSLWADFRGFKCVQGSNFEGVLG